MSDTPPNLGNIITSATARKIIYGVYGIAVVILGAAQVGYSTLGPQPSWLSVALNVAAYLAVPISALALANTSKPAE